jgi:hypothetical protein
LTRSIWLGFRRCISHSRARVALGRPNCRPFRAIFPPPIFRIAQNGYLAEALGVRYPIGWAISNRLCPTMVAKHTLRSQHHRCCGGWVVSTDQGLDWPTLSPQNYRLGKNGGSRLSGRLAIVRAAHLHSYLAVMHRIGVPVERLLERSRLPPRIAETPDQYVSIPMAMEWVAQSCRDLEPMHLGLLGAQESAIASLQPQHQSAILAAPTALTRLRALAGIAYKEDNVLRASLRRDEDEVRVILDMAYLDRHPFICFAEWLNLQGAISVVRAYSDAS